MGRLLFILLQYLLLAMRLAFLVCFMPITIALSIFFNGREKTVDQLFQSWDILSQACKGTWKKFSADYETLLFMRKLHAEYRKNLREKV